MVRALSCNNEAGWISRAPRHPLSTPGCLGSGEIVGAFFLLPLLAMQLMAAAHVGHANVVEAAAQQLARPTGSIGD
jgi:hypothetical protein